MLTATLLAVLLVPVFFVVTRRLFPGTAGASDAFIAPEGPMGRGRPHSGPTREGDA